MEIQKFDKHFEEKIIHAMIVDDMFARQMMDVVELKFFDLSYTTRVAELLIQHYKNYDTFPTTNLLESILNREEKDETLRRQCLAFLGNIKKQDSFNDLEYVKDKSLNFFRIQNMYKVLDNEVLPILDRAQYENGDFLEEISKVVQRASLKGSDANLGYDYLSDETERFKESTVKFVPTGWEDLDEVLNGGIEQCRVLTLIGSAGTGKSSVLVNLGAAALLSKKENGEGYNVCHVSMELSSFEIAKKYDACITGVEINDIINSKDKVLNELKVQIPNGSKLFIVDYPMKGASVQTIENYLLKLKIQGILIDLLVIDYGDILSSSMNNKEKRHNLESIWMDMKGLAQKWKLSLATATQSNRSGYTSDLLTPDQVSEDFSKIMHSDYILTLARSLEQKKSGIGKALLAKSRSGSDGHVFAFIINTARCKVDICELTEEIQEKIEQMKMSEEALKQQGIADNLKKALQAKNG